MEEEWDADGFEPKALKVASKWDDEDVDDDVKDNWEDEDEEQEKKDVEKQDETQSSTQPPKKTKKNLTRKIEEKEREEQRMREEILARKQMTPEEKLAEKLKQQKLQEEADLKAAIETFGVNVSEGSSELDSMMPSTKEEFEEFGKLLVKRMTVFSASQHFPVFVEDLVRNLCVSLPSADLKKLKNTIENLHLEKTKLEKGDKAKKNKGKAKAKLRIEGDSQALVNEYSAYGEMDDFDEFM